MGMEMEPARREEEIVYVCAKCGRELTPRDLALLHGVRCVYCGGRILYKTRSPRVKEVKAI